MCGANIPASEEEEEEEEEEEATAAVEGEMQLLRQDSCEGGRVGEVVEGGDHAALEPVT